MINSKKLSVTRDNGHVVIDITCDDPYAAVVLYEHVVECLDTGAGFAVNIGGTPKRAKDRIES